MPTKVNVVLDDDVKAQMDLLVPSGRRSRVVNQALRNELLRINRERVVQQIDKLRQRTKRAKTEEIVELLRRERRRP
jgi:Arc/MetJ-type ribon-helix-helix transcriptional regulator